MKVIHKFEHVANLLDKQGRLKNEIYCKMKEFLGEYAVVYAD